MPRQGCALAQPGRQAHALQRHMLPYARQARQAGRRPASQAARHAADGGTHTHIREAAAATGGGNSAMPAKATERTLSCPAYQHTVAHQSHPTVLHCQHCYFIYFIQTIPPAVHLRRCEAFCTCVTRTGSCSHTLTHAAPPSTARQMADLNCRSSQALDFMPVTALTHSAVPQICAAASIPQARWRL